MDQVRVIKQLCDWLRTNRWSESSTVRCDHVSDDREELALFIGPKKHGKGRGSRIAQVDLLVCNEFTKTVELIVEVDPTCTPKKLLGDVMSVLLADNYAPSGSLFPYSIKDTLVIFVTLLDCRQGSQKASQFELIESAIRQKLRLGELGAKDVVLCHGVSDEEAIYNCQRVIQGHFGTMGALPDSATSEVRHADAPPTPGQSRPLN